MTMINSILAVALFVAMFAVPFYIAIRWIYRQILKTLKEMTEVLARFIIELENN